MLKFIEGHDKASMRNNVWIRASFLSTIVICINFELLPEGGFMKWSVCVLGLFLTMLFDANAQSVDEAVKDKRFTITVESMSPRRGGYRRLTTLYTFKVTPDTVETELPYVGRAYQAPIGNDAAGVKFLSTDFEYQSKPGKRGAWEITLKIKDAKNFPLVHLTVQPSGSASIRMTPVDREFISYTGTLQERN